MHQRGVDAYQYTQINIKDGEGKGIEVINKASARFKKTYMHCRYKHRKHHKKTRCTSIHIINTTHIRYASIIHYFISKKLTLWLSSITS